MAVKMNSYVKRLIILIVLNILFIPVLAVNADVILEPENDFYSRNEKECVYLGRSFCAARGDRTVYAKKAPDSNENVADFVIPGNIYVEYSCLYKGEYWGLASVFSEESGWRRLYGWIKLSEFYVLYDYVAFDEDFSEEFYAYKGDYAEIKKTRAAAAWPWPGADSPIWTVVDLDTANFSVLHAYKDGQGREWGFVTYLYGSRNIWVCLSDPLNKDIPAFNPAPGPAIWKPDTAHIDIGKSGNPALAVIIILVGSLAVGTAILIKLLWKPEPVLHP